MYKDKLKIIDKRNLNGAKEETSPREIYYCLQISRQSAKESHKIEITTTLTTSN